MSSYGSKLYNVYLSNKFCHHFHPHIGWTPHQETLDLCTYLIIIDYSNDDSLKIWGHQGIKLNFSIRLFVLSKFYNFSTNCSILSLKIIICILLFRLAYSIFYIQMLGIVFLSNLKQVNWELIGISLEPSQNHKNF